MRYILLFISLLGCSRMQATHIVGGDITYTHTGNHVYEVRLMLYIDCYNGSSGAISQDVYANIGVFDGDSGHLIPALCQSVRRANPVRVSKTHYNCIKISPDACVDAYEYRCTMTLPPARGGYYLSFQRCCRNNTIINLKNPESSGENIWTLVSDTASTGSNSSPVFKNLPPNFLCTNAPLVFDHSATDADGDSLVYDFFHPYSGGSFSDPRPNLIDYQLPPFSQVVFETGFSPGNAIPSLPAAGIDPLSGQLRITPTMAGQFVVGIVVREYRKGILIGQTRRDFQFNVQNCVFETTSAFVTPAVNCNREVFFSNNSQNADTYFWEFGDSTTLSDTSSLKAGYYRYPGPGVYLVKLTAARGNCIDSVKRLVQVYDRIHFRLPADTLLCRMQSLTLFPDSLYPKAVYLWNNGSTDSSIESNGPGLYWLRIRLGSCETSDSIFIHSDTLLVSLLPDSLVCDPETHALKAVLKAEGPYQDLHWWTETDADPPASGDSAWNINRGGVYRIWGSNLHGCPFSDSAEIAEPPAAWMHRMPNVFTPNSDGVNDVFPEAGPTYSYRLWVFDRWGIEVYRAENSPWQAALFPDGSYYYFIEMESCAKKEKAHGVLRIIR